MRSLVLRSAVISICLAPVSVQAETCSAAATLAGLHDAYVALSAPDAETRMDAAIALLAIHLPEADPASLGSNLGPDFDLDEDRLAGILRDTLKVAQETVATGNLDLPEGHLDDIDWLADIVWDSGCEKAWGPEGPARRLIADSSGFKAPLNLILAAALAILGAGTAFAGIFMLRRSRLFRRHELREQPRIPVSIEAMVTVDNGEQHDVRILDLSLGGMKIALENPAPQDTNLTVTIGERSFPASIAWRNDFYAGLLLDTALTDSDLKDLLAGRISAAGGKATQASK